MNSPRYIVDLKECTGDCVELVGGKATGLGALLVHGCPVPPGFAITTNAYREFIQSNQLSDPLARMLSDGASEDIPPLFEASPVPPHLEDQICSAYTLLCGGADLPVAALVRYPKEDGRDLAKLAP